MEGIEVIEYKIYGRVDPHIYAFETNTVPNFLKVGDTYRPVSVRLAEWKKYYDKLIKRYEKVAKVDEKTFFRDYSVHDYLISHGFRRIRGEEFQSGIYKSNEFFQHASCGDVEDAINDIQRNFDEGGHLYTYYNIEDRLPLGESAYERDADWEPRKNQKDVIENYKSAIKNGRTNLLMYAVMRFGKSFTALCCAKETDAKLVVVVCGKADVREEWKKNVQRPKILAGYYFVDSKSLKETPGLISQYLCENKRVVVFLTLQDLLGDNIKNRHKDLFLHNQRGDIDLLIIDESHFAARSAETGKVLAGLNKNDVKRELKEYDDSIDDLADCVKQFSPTVKLHLSGTPYRILMNGEFRKEDIIAFVQYTDIIKKQQEWDEQNIDKDEWENPYYGFPQMVRFAFNLNHSSLVRLKELQNEGIDYRLNTLLRPQSLSKDADGLYKKFRYENEVLDLVRAIDGSKEDGNIFSFLNYKKIKEGNMCRHIVMVLPFCASCDAMQNLLQSHSFNNLNEYEILNISGLNCPSRYVGTNINHVENVIDDIRQCETEGKKTITLTVGKMLTGSTVEQWDTMIFLKGVSSPQEYDQAIFRLQNQYVKKVRSEDGKVIVYNMKPQTLLVDFDPTRLFVMQNRKSLISNINSSVRGNDELENQLKTELEISPIILLNKGKLKEVVPNDIIDAVRQYSANKSILDETFDIVIDEGVFFDDALKTLIEKEPEMTASGTVFSAKPNKGTEDDVDTGDDSSLGKDSSKSKRKPTTVEEEQKSLRKKLQTYYFKILLFAYLSDGKEKTLADIISCIEQEEVGKRVAHNIQLDVEGLKLIRDKIHPTALNELENKINNIDTLSGDAEADIQTALHRFARLSESEVTTPGWVASEMIDSFPNDVTPCSKFLNIAGKIGEFEYALIQRYGKEVRNNIFTIPTSGVTYECTRKMFSLLGIPVENIINDFTTFDFIDKKNQEIIAKLSDMNFDVITGNPPYQMIDGGGRGDAAQPIYDAAVSSAKQLCPRYLSLIIPARWYSGGRGLDEFRNEMLNDKRMMQLHDYPETSDLFKNVNIRGGMCYFLRGTMETNCCKVFNHLKGKTYLAERPLLEPGNDIFIRYNKSIDILRKVQKGNEKTLSSYVSVSRPFGLRSNFADFVAEKDALHPIKLYRFGEDGYVNEKSILRNKEMLSSYKVLVSKASPGGDEIPHGIISKPIVSEPGSICSETYLILKSFSLESEAVNMASYARTRFFRFMVLLAKNGQNLNRLTYRFVPLQDFSKPWTDDELYQKYQLSPDEIAFVETMIKP